MEVKERSPVVRMGMGTNHKIYRGSPPTFLAQRFYRLKSTVQQHAIGANSYFETKALYSVTNAVR
jgi:hypothetical protein